MLRDGQRTSDLAGSAVDHATTIDPLLAQRIEDSQASLTGMTERLMRLGDEARMNTPGYPSGNWSWRYLPHQLHDGLAAGLGELTATYGRRNRAESERGSNPYDYTVPGASHPLNR